MEQIPWASACFLPAADVAMLGRFAETSAREGRTRSCKDAKGQAERNLARKPLQGQSHQVMQKIRRPPCLQGGRRWGSVRLALERDCGSLLPSLSPSPVQPCTLPAFFLSLFLVLLRFFSFLFLSAAGALLWLVLAVDKRVRPGKAREAKLLWLAAPSGPIALLHIGLKRDVRHPAAAKQAAGALLWFVLAAAKQVRPPSTLDAKLFLLVAPWGPLAFYFLYRIQK